MSASSVRSRETLAPAAAQLFGNPLLIIVGLAFIVRLLFVPSLGFHNDVAAFEAWTLSLHDHPPWEFYAHTSFADYPPGYFVVLCVLAKIYSALQAVHVISASDPSYFGLRVLVKLPAIAMDLVDAVADLRARCALRVSPRRARRGGVLRVQSGRRSITPRTGVRSTPCRGVSFSRAS